MSTAIKQEVIPQNLYQIPSCTICLQQLSSQLVSLDCGHIFHVGCISQHFQYKATCPNCQKRVYQKEVRQIHFPLIQNNKANARLRTLLSSLELSERKQVELLLAEVKMATQLNQKLQYDKIQNEKEIKTQSKLIQHLREQLYKKKNEVEILRKENIKLDTNCQGMSEELNLRQKNQIRLRIELDKCRKDQREYEQVRKYKKLMSDNSEEIVKYREQLELKGTSPQEILKIFFDMLMMKNLEVLKMKDRVRDYPQKLSDKQFQISKLKGTIDVMKKEAKQSNEKKVAERKKYDQLKSKFRVLSDKAKLKGLRQNDIPQMQQSQGFMNLTKNFHIPEDPIVQNTLRKPLFSSSSTIGGLFGKKKDDKMKIYS